MCDVMTKGPNDLLSQNASQLFVNTWFLVGACNRLSMDFIMTSSGAEFTHWCSLWDIHVAPLSLIQMLSPGRGATCHAFCSACPLPLPCFGEWWSIVVPLHISIRQALKTKKLFRCHGRHAYLWPPSITSSAISCLPLTSRMYGQLLRGDHVIM